MNTIMYRLLLIFLLVSGCAGRVEREVFVAYVDPLIGTASSSTLGKLSHGSGTESNAQVVPYVTVPFGMTN